MMDKNNYLYEETIAEHKKNLMQIIKQIVCFILIVVLIPSSVPIRAMAEGEKNKEEEELKISSYAEWVTNPVTKYTELEMLKSGKIKPAEPDDTYADTIERDKVKAAKAAEKDVTSSVAKMYWGIRQMKKEQLAESLNALNKQLQSLKLQTVGKSGKAVTKYLNPAKKALYKQINAAKKEYNAVKGTGIRTPVDWALGLYGLYDMTWENPKVGYKSPFLEYCANYVRFLSNAESIVAPQFGIFFSVPELVVTSDTAVKCMNDNDERLRKILKNLDDMPVIGIFVPTLETLDDTTEKANGLWRSIFVNTIWTWTGDAKDNEELKSMQERYVKAWKNMMDDKEKMGRYTKRQLAGTAGAAIKGAFGAMGGIGIPFGTAYGATCSANNVGAYKPNIYLYPTEDTEFRVQFSMPELLRVTDPLYENDWSGIASPDGTLSVHGETYPYLFYESWTDPNYYQRKEGFVIPAETRKETLEQILAEYGLNEQEIKDFVEFWCEKLDAGCDYAMYPQTNEILDISMPVTVTPQPDSVLRIWFAFVKDETPDVQAVPETFERNGFTMVEWGGLFPDEGKD